MTNQDVKDQGNASIFKLAIIVPLVRDCVSLDCINLLVYEVVSENHLVEILNPTNLTIISILKGISPIFNVILWFSQFTLFRWLM